MFRAKTRYLIFFLFVFFFNACGYYQYQNRLTYPKYIAEEYQVLEDFEGVYVSQVVGRDSTRLLELLKESFRKEDYYKVFDTFPFDSDLSKLGVVEVKIEDVNFWEINQLPEEDTSPVNIYNQDLTYVPIVISNLRIRFRFKITNGATNEVVLDELVEQSFQQYYTGQKEIETRPDAETENDRLSRLAFDRFVAKLNFDQEEEYLYYELGENDLTLPSLVGFGGNALLKKGVRLAEGKNYNDALLTWMVVAFEPNEDITQNLESLNVYAKNRASALYNMGQVYRYLGDWGQASRMYALANQSVKKLHYAQAWSDAIQIWKSVKAQNIDFKTGIVESDGTFREIDTNNLIFAEEQQKFKFKRKLDNRQLLNAEQLWPFSNVGEDEQKNRDSSIIQK